MDEIKSLESQLRSLPRPTAPDELLGKLLADIPTTTKVSRQRKAPKSVWLCLAVAAALLVAASISIVRSYMERPDKHAISAHYVIHRPTFKQETDPCNVFPPLADLRHRF